MSQSESAGEQFVDSLKKTFVGYAQKVEDYMSKKAPVPSTPAAPVDTSGHDRMVAAANASFRAQQITEAAKQVPKHTVAPEVKARATRTSKIPMGE